MSYNYQEKLIAQIRDGRRLVVARYGAGKCRVSFEVAKHTVSTGGLVVVFCPRRNVRTWQKEAALWFGEAGRPYLDYHDYELTPHARLCSDQRYLLLMKYPKAKEFKTFVQQLVYLKPDLVILDESTAIKNIKSLRSQYMQKIAAALPQTIRLCLTGDPAPENLTELWAQFEFCYTPYNPLGHSYYRFLNKWMLKADYQWVLRVDKAAEFRELFDKYTCRLDEEDVEEIKENLGVVETYQTVLYKPSKRQLELMYGLQENWSLPISLESYRQEEYWHTMSILHKSAQIANGFYYVKGEMDAVKKIGKPIRLPENPKGTKLKELTELLQTQGHSRIVVWYAYRADLFEIEKSIGFVYGDCPLHLEIFASDSARQMVIALQVSAARGLNDLKTSAIGIFYSNLLSQEMRNQAEGRLPRPGQKANIIVHIDLACEQLADYHIVTALQNKQLTPERCQTIAVELLEGQNYARIK